MGNIVIHDTADVTITDLNSGKVVLNAEAQLAQITGAISEEDLKGGIGNRKLYKIRTDKEVNLTMRSAVANREYWAMTQGVEVKENGEAFVTANERGVLATDGTIFELVLPETTKAVAGSIVKVNLLDGTQADAEVVPSVTELAKNPASTRLALELSTITPVAPVFTLTTVGVKGDEGKELTVFYQTKVVGSQIKIDSTKFAGKYKVEMRTIAYDLDTATVTSEIYFIFPETIPAGEFDISLENGSVYTPEISFSVMNPIGSSEMGEIIEVAR